MNKKPLLSICIPTYNGASSSLSEVLKSVLCIASDYDGEIEVIVSDNASSDDTEKLLASYDNVSPYFRHYRNHENKGFNGNMKLLLDNYSHGEYSWMIGDDDIILPKAIPFLMKILEETAPDYLSVGFKFVQNSDIAFEINNNNVDYSIKSGTYGYVMDHNCLRCNTLATFMGSSVFKTEMFRKVPKDIISTAFDTFYNIFPNAYIIATAFHNKKCAYIPEAVVLSVIHDKQWVNTENSYRIFSSAIVDMYHYVINLGVHRTELKRTRNRILYDNAFHGFLRIKEGLPVSKMFYKSVFLSILHPEVATHLMKNFFQFLLHKPISDIG